ncbi:MAG TPA: alpha-isopropylmalate synthase regulatory domain-containing protein, partial [Armatimonadota bacterium]|nr:alpha-isopropylmalate synthase regulatory domain-containing protein [Armatimonadota bacterium]
TDAAAMVAERFHLEYYQVVAGTHAAPTATVKLVKDGTEITRAGLGVGSVDAVYATISEIAGLPHALVDYVVHSVTGGTDAMGEVAVRISDQDGRVFTGRGADTDIINASAKAYVQALNRLAAHQPSFSPQEVVETV